MIRLFWFCVSVSVLIVTFYGVQAFLQIETNEVLASAIGITNLICCLLGVAIFFTKSVRGSWVAAAWTIGASFYVLWICAMFFLIVFF